MGRVWVKELTGGLDTRRMPETTPGGVLIKGQDGHITSGGEFEKRAAFVTGYVLPAGTFGLAKTRTGVTVFGIAASAAVPSGVSYQQLAHPDGVTDIDRILSYDLYGGKLYVVVQFEDGSIYHYYDGSRVTDWFDGRARASFTVVSGGATSELTTLFVNGVSIMSGAVTWTTSNENTADLIAAAINGATSSPDYEATAVGDQVNIIAATAGAGSNGFAVSFVSINALTLDPPTGLVMAGGVTSTTTFAPGTFVRTIGSKVYSVSGPLFHFSGIRAPTAWTTDATGAGFTDMSQEASDAEELIAVANYQGFVAIFAPGVVIIQYVDPDPDLNRKAQVLGNTGTNYANSITEYGDSDLFYLAESGCRSLKARDSSNAAATVDIGVPIDTLIRAKLKSMTADQKAAIVGLINRDDGRFWLIMGDTVYVFSYFSNAKVSAWTTYTMVDDEGIDFEVDGGAVVFNSKVHVRAGNTIYVFGGLGSELTYDETSAKAWLPLLAAEKPSEFKGWNGIDAAVEGQWDLYAAMQPVDLTVRELIATVTETTFNAQRIPFDGQATHVSPQLESRGAGQAKFSSLILHYLDSDSES